MEFSLRQRAAWRDELARRLEPCDLLIIGGGITGAGILLDARSRGMDAVLVDMQDFAAGTSNRSTKLVHGGLRYLKQMEIGLVAEVGRERAVVQANARHVTTPVRMLLPIVQGGTYGRLATAFALWLYDTLAGVKHSERHRMLNAQAALRAEPLLNPVGLKGAGEYVEYRTDDARLTLEVVKAGVERGGIALNYTRVEEFCYEDGRVAGVVVADLLTGHTYQIRARRVVNAAGPWVDALRDKDGSKRGKTLRHTKGVHIVLDGSRLPLSTAVYFDVPDGRMVFAIPRAGKTYIGTTDTDYDGDLIHPVATEADRTYLLQAANHMFARAQLGMADIESSWAGVRPLIYEEGKSPSEVSRKDEVLVSESGLVTIAGGKLTGYRKMAEKVVDLVSRSVAGELGRRLRPCSTRHISLSGGDFGSEAEFLAFVAGKTEEGVALGLSRDDAQGLATRYGRNVDIVFTLLQERGAEAEAFELPPGLAAEVLYAIGYELATSPSDFFIRRTGDLYFDVDRVLRFQSGVCALMSQELEWEEAECDRHVAALENRIAEAMGRARHHGSG